MKSIKFHMKLKQHIIVYILPLTKSKFKKFKTINLFIHNIIANNNILQNIIRVKSIDLFLERK